jgi:hypothetical protein
MEGSEISIIMSSPGSKFKLTNDFLKCPRFCRWMRGCCFEMSPISAEAKFPKVVHHQKWPAKSLVSVGSIRNLEHHMRSIYIYTYIYQISYILNLSNSKVCLFFFWLLLLCHKIWDRSAAYGSPSRGGTTFVGDPMVREPRGDGPTRECLDLQIGLMWLMVTYIYMKLWAKMMMINRYQWLY